MIFTEFDVASFILVKLQLLGKGLRNDNTVLRYFWESHQCYFGIDTKFVTACLRGSGRLQKNRIFFDHFVFTKILKTFTILIVKTKVWVIAEMPLKAQDINSTDSVSITNILIDNESLRVFTNGIRTHCLTIPRNHCQDTATFGHCYTKVSFSEFIFQTRLDLVFFNSVEHQLLT